MKNTAVFLDKDGTLIEDLPYNVDPEKIRLLPGAEECLRRLHAAGYAIFVATNQSGVARGYYTVEDMAVVERHLTGLLASFGVPLAGYYYCPHLPTGVVSRYAIRCGCRKPEPGLLLRAAREHGIDARASWFVGNILNDIEAGRRAGCRTVLINRGQETQWRLSRQRLPHHVVNSLREAAAVIARTARTGE